MTLLREERLNQLGIKDWALYMIAGWMNDRDVRAEINPFEAVSEINLSWVRHRQGILGPIRGIYLRDKGPYADYGEAERLVWVRDRMHLGEWLEYLGPSLSFEGLPPNMTFEGVLVEEGRVGGLHPERRGGFGPEGR